MIARIPDSPPLCLADATPGDLVQVRLIVFELVRSRCWHLPLREGDTLRFVQSGDETVTVARLDGSQVDVPHECARFIGVQRLTAKREPEPAASVPPEDGGAPVRWERG